MAKNHKNSATKYLCSICSNSFKWLKKHMQVIHEQQEKHCCDTCGKEFRTVTNLTNHKRIHLGTEFACEVQDCGQKFTTRHMLKEHVNHVHLNIRPFECETCSRSFKSKVMLKSHQKIHSEVLGYICPYCGKGFKQSSVLYRHKLSCPMNMGNVWSGYLMMLLL